MDEAGQTTAPLPLLCQQPLTHTRTPHMHMRTPELDYRPFLDFFSWPLSCNRLPLLPKPTSSEVSACRSRCSSVGQTTLKWCGRGPVRVTHAKAFDGSAAKPISEPPTSAPPTPRLHLPPIKEANPLTVLSLCQFMRLSVLASISFLTCLFASVFFFLSLSFSLCRFTLTYRELILLFLSFNKLLCKR